ncbi:MULTISPECIES: hypothetical protein [unclassified Microbacterium]|nr:MULTISPECIES: hypothetical protein [unclassified Microbacterium]
MRRGNIQHGRKRRMPWSVRAPIIILALLIPVLVWELTLFGGA